jgi:hypothetical protein
LALRRRRRLQALNTVGSGDVVGYFQKLLKKRHATEGMLRELALP